MSPDDFREFAHKAIDEFFARKVNQEDWTEFAQMLDYVPLGAGPGAVKAAVKNAEKEFAGTSWRLH